MGLSYEIDGQNISVTIRKNNQAKRLILRMDPKTGGVKVTLPPFADRDDALEMIARHQVWIANPLIKKQKVEPIQDGSCLIYKGQETLVRHDPARRGTVFFEEGEIIVCGKSEFFERRLRDALKKQARADISDFAYPMADILSRRIEKIVLRDTVPRWGSCTAKGVLNFNWRLIMAPPHILRYVVAHEVSHLKEMNHSSEFWAVVAKLHPQYKRDRYWLKKNGARIQGYQF